jgi:hypothetical protein
MRNFSRWKKSCAKASRISLFCLLTFKPPPGGRLGPDIYVAACGLLPPSGYLESYFAAEEAMSF